MNHSFTSKIIEEVGREFNGLGRTIFGLSPLLQYINKKTRSANRGSKARSSFANLYALYVLIEDYVNKGYLEKGDYADYGGADFTPLLRRMRELPFGSKLQNHSLNNRANDDFHKYFPEEDILPIVRDVSSRKYWINEALLTVSVGEHKYSLAQAVLRVIDLYVKTKRESFSQFIEDCERLREANEKGHDEATEFIRSLLSPERDARLFEISSYAILKAHFSTEIIFIGETRDSIAEEALINYLRYQATRSSKLIFRQKSSLSEKLFKTGRTNANDGGIDFVMKPLGRFFQVTEALDVKKYFLDIDKVERYPISFVIKTTLDIAEIRSRLEDGAKEQYGVREIVHRYMTAIEDIFNIPKLIGIFNVLADQGRVSEVLDEIIRWSKVEFNIEGGLDSAESVADEDEDADD